MNRYFQVFEDIGTGIFILNPEFKVQYWNVCLEDWTTVINADILGSTIWDYFPKFKQETLKKRIQSVFDDGMPVVLSSSLNKDLLVPEGHDLTKRKTYEVSVTLLDSVPEDPSIYTLFTVNNVTELTRKLEDVKELNKLANEEIFYRKKAEEKLVESEERYRALFEKSSDPMLILNNDRFVDCNEAGLKALKIKTKQAITQIKPWDISPLHQPDGMPSKVKALKYIQEANEKGSCQFDWLHTSMEGEDLWYNISLTKLILNKKEHIHTHWRDITNRKLAEQLLKESDVRLKQIFKTSQVGIVLTHNRTMNFVNHYLCELVGYNEAELVGKNARLLYPSVEEYESLGVRKFPKLEKSGFASEETLFKAKNGKIINVLMNSSFFNGKNDEDGVISVVTDISYLKEVETNLYNSQKKLIQKNEEKDTFISILGHDLMSLIGGSTQFIELMELDDPEMVNHQQLIALISQNTKAAYELLNDLITWGKASLGQITFSPSKLILEECFLKVVNTYSSQISEKKLELGINCNKNDWIFADANMLEAILRNLLRNAIKFTEEGGRINVSGELGNSTTRVCISDDGIGMSKEQIQKLLSQEVVESMHGTAGETGSGLGLKIIKEYIHIHQATMDLKSEKGKGTSFTIHFPHAPTIE
jgi:PAS domain S-box-containing protein